MSVASAGPRDPLIGAWCAIHDCSAVSPSFESFRCRRDLRLQRTITRIDSAPDREAELVRELETNPEFHDFVDNLLKAVPPGIEP
jgi:hypothetical protein